MSEQSKIYSIHFLRLFAAVGVLMSHSVASIFNNNTGAAGVDIFFVISGIVIGTTLKSDSPARQFTIKRLIRILPLYWLATLAMIVAKYYSWRVWPSLRELVHSALLLPEFGTRWQFIYFPAWTLAYEMLFYLTAAGLLALFKRHARATLLLVFAVLSATIINVPGDPQYSRLGTDMFFEFCAGLVLSEVMATRLVVPPKLGFVCIAVAIFMLFHNEGFLGVRPITWGIPAVILIVGMFAFEDAAWLRSKWSVVGGDASYSIYLTHLTVFLFIDSFGIRNELPFAQHQLVVAVFKVILALIVGVAVHLVIEKPMLRFLRRTLIPATLAMPLRISADRV